MQKGYHFRVKASFTIEAAFLMPVIILLLVWCISLSIGLYSKVDQSASDFIQVEESDSLEDFRKLSKAAGFFEGLKEER